VPTHPPPKVTSTRNSATHKGLFGGQCHSTHASCTSHGNLFLFQIFPPFRKHVNFFDPTRTGWAEAPGLRGRAQHYSPERGFRPERVNASDKQWRHQETHGVADSATSVAESATPWVSCSQTFWTIFRALWVTLYGCRGIRPSLVQLTARSMFQDRLKGYAHETTSFNTIKV